MFKYYLQYRTVKVKSIILNIRIWKIKELSGNCAIYDYRTFSVTSFNIPTLGVGTTSPVTRRNFHIIGFYE